MLSSREKNAKIPQILPRRPYNLPIAHFQGTFRIRKVWCRMVTKYQQDCIEALGKVENTESLPYGKKVSAVLQATIDATRANSREEAIEQIEELTRVLGAAVGLFNLKHTTKHSFSAEDLIHASPADLSFIAMVSKIATDALENVVYSALLEQDLVPTSPEFFSQGLEPAAHLLGAKATSRLGVAGLPDKTKEATVNGVVSGACRVAANVAATMLLSQYNSGACLLGKPKLDEETTDSIRTELAEAALDPVNEVAKKWNSFLGEKLGKLVASAKASAPKTEDRQ